MGLIDRRPDGVFEVGDNHLSTALAFEERLVRRTPFSAQVASYWSLGEQIEAVGPTQLDRVLAHVGERPSGGGFGCPELRTGLAAEAAVSDRAGLDARQPADPAAAGALANGCAGTIGAGQGAVRGTGRPCPHLFRAPRLWRLCAAHRSGAGQDGADHWRAAGQARCVATALERFAGRQVEGIMRGHGLSWSLSRGLGIDLPPM